MRWAPLSVGLGVILLAALAPRGGSFEESDRVPWRRDLRASLAEAARRDTLVVVDVYAPWCGPCLRMERTTFEDPRVAARLEDFVPLKLNADEHPEFLARYRLPGVPVTLVLDPEERPLLGKPGYLAPEAYLSFLDRSVEAAEAARASGVEEAAEGARAAEGGGAGGIPARAASLPAAQRK